MKKIIFGIISLMFFVGSNPARAWNAGEFISCHDMNPMPEIRIFSSFGKLTYHHDLSSAEMTSRSKTVSQNKELLEKGYFIDGQAKRNLYFASQILDARVKRIDKNATCVLPAIVEFFIGYQKPEIYIANTIDKNSCRYAVVMRHEQAHQQINKLVLEHFLPLLSRELSRAVHDVKAVKVSDRSKANQGLEDLNLYYKARVQPIINAFIETLNEEHGKLDNLTNYQMENQLCRDFEQKHHINSSE